MPAARRSLLVQAAAHEFASNGYVNASLNRIIETCGMSKSSFYYVIPSKSDLFDFVVGDLIERVRSIVDVPRPDTFAGDDFWPALADFCAGLQTVAERDEAFLTLGRMFYCDAPESATGPVADTWAAVREWLYDLLRTGRRCGAVRDDLPEALQLRVTLRILQVFDEWTVAHHGQLDPGGLSALADAQFATVRRVLRPG